MTRAKTLRMNILSNIFTHVLYQADEERSEAAVKQEEEKRVFFKIYHSLMMH